MSTSDALAVLVGEWDLEASFPGQAESLHGQMTIDDSRLTLERDDPDMTQRFVGVIGDGVIDGDWEVVGEDGDWEHDFRLVYRRRS